MQTMHSSLYLHIAICPEWNEPVETRFTHGLSSGLAREEPIARPILHAREKSRIIIT